MPSLTSYQVLFASQQHWKHSEVKNTLWDHYKELRRGTELYKVHCLCRWKAIFGDQCFLVTGNTKEFSFSIRKADHMGPASCLRQNSIFLALRNRVQGVILIPKTNPASLTSGCFYLSSTFDIHWLTDLLVSQLSSQGTLEVSSEASPWTTFFPQWSTTVTILTAGKAHSCSPQTPIKICLL